MRAVNLAELNTRKSALSLRISSSDVASIAGFHPFCNFHELVEKYVYQDL